MNDLLRAADHFSNMEREIKSVTLEEQMHGLKTTRATSGGGVRWTTAATSRSFGRWSICR
jgi:hypothetical protein